MEALGLDIKLIIAQIVNFGILFVVLSKLLYKPLLKVLDERRRKAEKEIEDSKKIEERLIALGEEEKTILKKTREKANTEKAELLALVEAEKQRIMEDAKRAADREVDRAITRINMEEAEAKRRLKRETTEELIGDIVKKLSETSKQNKPLLKKLLS